MADPITLVSTISAAMQAVQTWISVRDSKRTHSTARKGFTRTYNAKLARQQGQRISQLVPVTILSLMEQRVQECWKKYQNVIDPKNKRMPAEIDDATDALKNCICEELNRIYKLNGSIPSGKLRQWWKAYCNG